MGAPAILNCFSVSVGAAISPAGNLHHAAIQPAEPINEMIFIILSRYGEQQPFAASPEAQDLSGLLRFAGRDRIEIIVGRRLRLSCVDSDPKPALGHTRKNSR